MSQIGRPRNKDGCRVEVTRQYSGRPTLYTYLALRAGGRWFLTGQFGTAPKSDEEFFAWVLADDTKSAVILKRKVKAVIKG